MCWSGVVAASKLVCDPRAITDLAEADGGASHFSVRFNEGTTEYILRSLRTKPAGAQVLRVVKWHGPRDVTKPLWRN